MKRLTLKIALAVVVVGLFAVVARAQHGPASDAAFGTHLGGQAFRCLRNLDLSSAQKTSIQTILQNSQPTLKAEHDTLKADFQKLNADADAGADASVIGQDYLVVRGDHQKIKDTVSQIQTQIAAQLTDDQKAKFQSCVAALKENMPTGSHRGSF